MSLALNLDAVELESQIRVLGTGVDTFPSSSATPVARHSPVTSSASSTYRGAANLSQAEGEVLLAGLPAVVRVRSAGTGRRRGATLVER